MTKQSQVRIVKEANETHSYTPEHKDYVEVTFESGRKQIGVVIEDKIYYFDGGFDNTKHMCGSKLRKLLAGTIIEITIGD